jgi:hypothetical protein
MAEIGDVMSGLTVIAGYFVTNVRNIVPKRL